jgi:hypothetical protein
MSRPSIGRSWCLRDVDRLRLAWGEWQRQGNGGTLLRSRCLSPQAFHVGPVNFPVHEDESRVATLAGRMLQLSPECLEMSQHQAPHLAQLIVVGGEQRWISPQHRPTLGAQNPVQVS